MSYTPREYYDRDYRSELRSGKPLRRSDRWTYAFIEPLRAADARSILDLGCGLGYEVLTLSKEGFHVTGLDLSIEAVTYAQSMVGPSAKFILADMAEKLPLSDGCFDAVMSNVAAHMFSDSITRAVFSEVKRILCPGGLFLFHVGALEDRALRTKHNNGPGYFKQLREIEPNYVLLERIGARHFFSKEYLLELLSDWQDVHLGLVEILYNEYKEQYKHLVVNNHQGKRQRISLLERGFVLRRCLWRGIIRR